jgi:hypothetical protein
MNMNVYVISLINVILDARYKPREEHLLGDIKTHLSNIKREIARDELSTVEFTKNSKSVPVLKP